MGEVLTLAMVIKLASIVVHAQELNMDDPDSAEFDVAAIKSLAHDGDVCDWLDTIDPVYLPEKRHG